MTNRQLDREVTVAHLLALREQLYDWGSTTAIPDLRGWARDGRPHAELWIGAHAGAPSSLADGRPLDRVIAADPDQELGPGVAGRFGRLPFLLKVLAAARPLSLQVHPSAEQAEAGFRREEAQGPDRAAADRLPATTGRSRRSPARSPRPKRSPASVPCRTPWPSFAVSPTGRTDRGRRSWPGWRTASAAARRVTVTFAATPFAPTPLAATGRTRVGLGRSFAGCSAGPARPGPAAAAVATTVRGAASTGLSDPGAAPSLRDACELVDGVGQQYPHDAGLVLLPLLHHLRLKPGQALFTPAGVLHSYLSGTVVELMAASDNVLRGGLTSKHVDVDELMAVLDAAPSRAGVVAAVKVSDAEWSYPTPTPQFALSRVDLSPATGPVALSVGGPQLFVCVSGRALVDGAPLVRGTAAYVSDRVTPVSLVARHEPATVFRARVGPVS